MKARLVSMAQVIKIIQQLRLIVVLFCDWNKELKRQVAVDKFIVFK